MQKEYDEYKVWYYYALKIMTNFPMRLMDYAVTQYSFFFPPECQDKTVNY